MASVSSDFILNLTLGLVAFVIGVVGIYIGIQQYRVLRKTSPDDHHDPSNPLDLETGTANGYDTASRISSHLPPQTQASPTAPPRVVSPPIEPATSSKPSSPIQENQPTSMPHFLQNSNTRFDFSLHRHSPILTRTRTRTVESFEMYLHLLDQDDRNQDDDLGEV